MWHGRFPLTVPRRPMPAMILPMKFSAKYSQPIPLASIYLDSYSLNHRLQIISKCRALPLWAQPV